MEKEEREINKEIYAQLGNIPDTLAERIATYRKNLEELISTMVEKDWEVQADAQDNPARSISITQEEYDADSDSTENNSAEWNEYWINSDSEEEDQDEENFHYESNKEPPNIDQVRKGARNPHINIPEGHHAYENWIQQRTTEAINDQIIKLQSEPNITCNFMHVEDKWNPIKEFPHVFPEQKPLSLPPLRYPLNYMQHHIKVRPGST